MATKGVWNFCVVLFVTSVISSGYSDDYGTSSSPSSDRRTPRTGSGQRGRKHRRTDHNDDDDTGQRNMPVGLNLLSPSLLRQAEFVERLPPYGWRFNTQFQGIVLTQSHTTAFVENMKGNFHIRISGLLLNTTQTLLFSILDRHRILPYVELSLDLPESRIFMRYLGVTSFQRVTLDNVFPSNSRWTDLHVMVTDEIFSAAVDCSEDGIVSAKLRQKIGVIPETANLVFGSRSHGQSGLQGVLFHATLTNHTDATLDCNAKLDFPVSDQPLDPGSGFVLSSPRDRDQDVLEQRIGELEQQLAQLSLLVDNLRLENTELKERVAHLETCDCVPSCSFNGTVFSDGEVWFPEECTQCQCINSKSECSRRQDLPHCADPCFSSPCLNNGQCINPDTDVDITSFQCQCPSPYDGNVCQTRQNPCAFPVDPGQCGEEIVRYYYDKLSQTCQPFMFSGCGGNVNNFLNLEECTRVALTGACCYRTYRTGIDHVTRSTQQIDIKCQELHMSECKALHRQSENATETEVISFNPGLTCAEAACQTTDVCVVGQRVYSVGQDILLGCQKCRCEPQGQISCLCEQVSTRKEIRDMTQEELVRFQKAVAQLRASEDRTWEQFRDLHMYHVMHSGGGPFFLPWQRTFLRQVEQRLQEIDCRIVLPYFDFTTDVGFFEEAVIWETFLYGGNGDGKCVEDHPFGDKDTWTPCLVRNFNTSIQLPSRLELQLAIASDDFDEMSACLETYIAYVHNFIGGDLMTSSSPYDPVHYAVHAFVDMLYWTWQQRGDNKFKFPAAYGNIPMIPFNIPPWAVFDSESDLCVTYALPSKGNPCNFTTVGTPKRRLTHRSDTEPDSDLVVTNHTGLGHPYKNGYNRDGYDKNGYDFGGFDRYGFNANGYDRHGYDRNGRDRFGNTDNTGRFNSNGFDMDCLNREGLTREGLDLYGFYTTGLDLDGCMFYFNGPFSPIQSYRIHSVLGRQPKSFLMGLTRTCPQLSPLPANWLHLNWVPTIKDVTGLVPVNLPDMQSGPSSRFCFDTSPYLTPCSCDGAPARCQMNPCHRRTCEAFPEAFCRVDFCGTTCSARWLYRGKEVDCRKNRDHCDPNPCLNGGTCQRSIWLNEPSKVTCQCPPGFEGHLCQHPVLDRCQLPLARGSCDERQERWYFNSVSGRCERFRYLGCGGNANQFASQVDCQDACVIGSCCWREPRYKNQNVGLDNQGYDKYGFNEEGFNRFGEQRRTDNSFPFGNRRFDSEGVDWQGFDREGFGPEDSLNRAGYDVDGFDNDGFNLTGYSRNGEYDGIIDYNQDGYDEEGFNRAGLSCHGNDRQGYDVFGVAAAYKHSCEITTMFKCQENARGGLDVIKFTPGKTCEESGCGEECGCRHGNKVYGVYQRFTMGCQSCVCNEKGVAVCSCDSTVKRKEIRDLTSDQLKRYQKAIRQLLTETGQPSQWYTFASLYASHKPSAVGSPLFLPWNRQFLRHVEQALQDIDCSLAIPYYDWRVDAGKPYKTLIWAANMMGGNGGDNDCVRYHPFKPYYPPYLSPCLRRNFNTSMTLPSAVNIELALREPSYDRFRLQMEMFLRMYLQFVGGHMASDLAPYDPLYYSVMAYVDKLWTEWQQRNPQGLLAFPLEKRYTKLSPFKTTPDDVFESGLQMCVSYTPLTLGSVCNVTSHKAYPGYNTQGYDRHGYDREGYDKDGYNVDGNDASGNSDTRGIYNIHGYDREGFSRSGFDSMGMDRHGFYTDSFNLDGMDIEGFDRYGYNRYGYNRKGYTPYGYNIDGSTLENINISELEILDPFGYNKYGYNQEGFNRNGYDIFGFDAKRYDERRCNRYYRGPLDIMIIVRVTKSLAGLDSERLKKVKRICSPLQPLPGYIIRQNWLNRARQRFGMRALYPHHDENHPYDTLYVPKETSVTPDLIWIPIAPDQRFCFVTEIYTNCHLGENQMLCSDDLCFNKVCPGNPTALCRVESCGVCQRRWYDGLTGQPLDCSGCIDNAGQGRREGETWTPLDDPCSSCTCQDGESRCQKVGCPPTNCQNPVQLDDQCCPSCDGCDYRGKVIMSGSEFMLDDDPCSRCKCEAGNVRCSFVECPDLGGCKSRVRPTDQCCDICLDCGERGHGDRWMPEPCQECMCQSGQVRCSRVICGRTTCDHPSIPPGECCAKCSACLYEGKMRRNGESFSPRPCEQCLCQDGNVECSAKVCPRPECSNPIRVEGECCPVCGLDCEYEGQRQVDGSFFSPSYNPCMNCSCANSIVHCRSVRCPDSNLPCRNPIKMPGECCPSSCPTCDHNGVEYNEGDRWEYPRNTKCSICQCRNGAVQCRLKQECPRQCAHGIFKRPECCSRCEDCLFEDYIYGQGETRTIHGDICRQCTCNYGTVTCRDVVTDRECPRLDCRRTELKPGICCPVCAGCVYRDQRFEHGALVSKDECSECACDGGEISCTEPACPEVKCSKPIKPEGHCCPICDGCFYYGQEYMNGDSFRSRYDACQQCTCLSGKVECASVAATCPQVSCTHPGKRKDQCCPVCDICAYERKTLFNGQRLIGSNPCEICVCKKGSVICESTVCPSVECQSPIVKPGRCCPSCDGICTMDGVDYQEGQVFKRPGVDCSTCVCKNGKVTCEVETCQPLTCQHPARLPNECCPKCNFCLYERRIFRNQQRFVHPWDMCQQCSCQYGTVTCVRTECEKLPCANPMPMPGSCCPSCPKQCEHQGLFYDDGETFINPQNKCEDCLCRQGTTRCKSRMCPRVSCANPVFDGCCQRCTDCEVQNVVIKNGETKQDPNDVCAMCTCTDGDVRCESVLCPSVSCSNPVVPVCCPVCNDCEYRGRIYNNGAIIDIGDRCRTCLCRDGNVECQTTQCPAVNCLHPEQGLCCQECRGCDYRGVGYRDGQVFPDTGDMCQDCVCSKGNVMCLPKVCPAVTCSHPTQGRCCRECQSCFYSGRVYSNGDTFLDPAGDGCQDCVCTKGSVECQSRVCPPVTCTHPTQGMCCQECRECMYRGQLYPDGDRFPDPAGDGCQDCVCSKGSVICQAKLCPPVTCTHPTQGRCCQECRDCMQRGVTYRDGQMFPDPTDACSECRCDRGSVSCHPMVCPQAQCTHPIPGRCCNECRDCLYNGITVSEGRAIDNPDDPCEECRCDRGSVTCYRQQCPLAGRCQHPVTRGCCQECDNCFYGNVEYRNGEQFSDPASNCISCRCTNGDVTCKQIGCPPAPCSHPVQGECCLQCGGSCDFQGQVIRDGQRVASATDRCQECRCNQGSVRCYPTDCSKFPQCSHPIEIPGECCPVCGMDCLYEGSIIQDGGGFKDNCQECECHGGDIKCQPKTCPRVDCSNPVLDGCCQMCSDCQTDRNRYINGQTFPDRQDPCGQCQCKDGTVTCRRKPCPSPQCSHPIRGACCEECDGCLYNRQTFSNGQRFADPENTCRECVCKLGSVVCNNKRCRPVSCQDPAKDSCGCPSCHSCLYQGLKVKDGERFASPTNPCQECYCRGGSVTCNKAPCTESCSHPARRDRDGCCPQCDACLYQGSVLDNQATVDSSSNPCHTCTCHRGSVTCKTKPCPPVTCLQPVKVEGDCCLSCPMCVYMGKTYLDNQRFQHPEDLCQTCSCKMGRVECESERCPATCSHPRKDVCCPKCDACFFEDTLYANGLTFQPDSCRSCMCKDGNVVCEEQTCRALPCKATRRAEGSCCDSCQGCTFRGILYDEDASWVLPDNPCISCSCHNGLVTCMDTQCFVPCSNPITLPGQCCPVCPSCHHEGRMYSDGQDFTPNGDPCDQCHCKDGNLRCIHDTCPNVASCPSGSLRDPEPGSCCPTCDSAVSTDCTISEIGQIRRPRSDDPCLVCECKEDFMWVCTREKCRGLACPPDLHIYAEDTCCPQCPACFDVTSAKFFNEGETWAAVDDPCIQCTCRDAEVKCEIMTCPAISCQRTETAVILEGQCCHSCQNVPDATCEHQGITNQPGSNWMVDECTSCECLGGEVSCRVQQCPLTECPSDEIFVNSPGQCCPVCQKRPGTCLVFGDPHYRTFDGATLHFQGMCKYIMATDCEDSTFKVEVHHDNRGARGEVSWAQNITVSVAGIQVDLLQNNVVKVDSERVELPYLFEPHVQVERSGNTVLLSTQIGVKVLWDGDNYGEVIVPGSYKRRLCGLCGNFNGFAQDDLRTKAGQITNSPATFGNSWKSTNQQGEACQDARDIDPCSVSGGYRLRKMATSRCSILQDKAFSRCHRVVSPETYFSSCVYDMCVCMDEPKCLCDIVTTYARECARMGVRVEWRTQQLCAFDCDASKGFVFDECGPVCPRTCENAHPGSSNRNMTEKCFKPCVPGCQCTADKVLHQGRCVSQEECPFVPRIG